MKFTKTIITMLLLIVFMVSCGNNKNEPIKKTFTTKGIILDKQSVDYDRWGGYVLMVDDSKKEYIYFPKWKGVDIGDTVELIYVQDKRFSETYIPQYHFQKLIGKRK